MDNLIETYSVLEENFTSLMESLNIEVDSLTAEEIFDLTKHLDSKIVIFDKAIIELGYFYQLMNDLAVYHKEIVPFFE